VKTLALLAALFAAACAAPSHPSTLPAAQESSCGLGPGYQDLAALLDPIRRKHNLPALGAAVLPDQDPAYASVTIEQLLAHRSGLAHDPTSVSNNALRLLQLR
jgi:hypothetical protein